MGEAAEDRAAADAVLGEVDRCGWSVLGFGVGQLSEAVACSAVFVVAQ